MRHPFYIYRLLYYFEVGQTFYHSLLRGAYPLRLLSPYHYHSVGVESLILGLVALTSCHKQHHRN